MFAIKVKNCFIIGFGLNGDALTLTGLECNAMKFASRMDAIRITRSKRTNLKNFFFDIVPVKCQKSSFKIVKHGRKSRQNHAGTN